MDNLLNLEQPVRVELLCMTSAGPVMLRGQALQGSSKNEIKVSLDESVEGDLIGAQVIMSASDQQVARLTAQITHCASNLVTLNRGSVRPRDKRLYPRLFGNIPLQYCHLADEDEATISQWLNQQPTQRALSLRTPEPFMNFSVSGLCFEDDAQYQLGDFMLLEFSVGERPQRWRASGRVVRIDAMPEEGEGVHSVAVNFEALPDGAMEALSDFTITIQEALL